MTCITAQQWRLQSMPGGRPDMETKAQEAANRGGLDFRWLSLLRPLRSFCRQLLPMMGPLSPERLALRILRHVCQSSAGFGFQTELGRVIDHMHQPSRPPPIPCAPCDPPAGPIARQCASGSRVQADRRCCWRRAGIARRSYGIVLTSAFCRDSTNAKSPYVPMRSRKRARAFLSQSCRCCTRYFYPMFKTSFLEIHTSIFLNLC